MADSEFSHKESIKVEEKIKGTNWPTFSLEMKSIFYKYYMQYTRSGSQRDFTPLA